MRVRSILAWIVTTCLVLLLFPFWWLSSIYPLWQAFIVLSGLAAAIVLIFPHLWRNNNDLRWYWGRFIAAALLTAIAFAMPGESYSVNARILMPVSTAPR
jgi:hypothetical protein